MFFRRSFFFVLFGLVLVFGLFGMRQRSNFAQGYAEGYAAAQQANSAEMSESDGAVAGAAEPAQTDPYRRGWGFFPILGFFGLLFKFWLMLMIFGFFMRMLGFGRRRCWHRGHWRGSDKQPYEKQPEDVEPDIRHA